MLHLVLLMILLKTRGRLGGLADGLMDAQCAVEHGSELYSYAMPYTTLASTIGSQCSLSSSDICCVIYNFADFHLPSDKIFQNPFLNVELRLKFMQSNCFI